MTNIAILTHPRKYPAHASLSAMISEVLKKQMYCVSILDVGSYKYGHECLAKLKELSPSALITLDLAGFSLKTQSGENALNLLFTKNLNLIRGNQPEYAPLLCKKLSLSMFFYDISGKNNLLNKLYPNLYYYKAWTLCDEAQFSELWKDFLRESLLCE